MLASTAYKTFLQGYRANDMIDRISPASIRILARHLINFPDPSRTKVLTSIPQDDRIKIIEEMKKLKDAKKNGS